MSGDIWTIKAALDWTVGYLERKGDKSPRISAQWLLAEATGLRRIELYMSLDRPLSLPERDVLRGYVDRRGKGEPLQYITGEVGFRHIAVKVRPGVLIPRPETEVLVSEALALLPAAPRPRATEEDFSMGAQGMPDAEKSAHDATAFAGAKGDSFVSDVGSADDSGRSVALDGVTLPGSSTESAEEGGEGVLLVADLCTGSGCIACSLAYEHPLVRVVATDLSREAVDLARENAEALGLTDRVDVVECDLGAGIPADILGNLDLVVSNPPYVPTSVLTEMPGEVTDYEPALALDGGVDGLDVFRPLLSFCTQALKPGGACVFELHEDSLDEAASAASATGFCDVRVVEDLAGRPRVLVARWPEEGKRVISDGSLT